MCCYLLHLTMHRTVGLTGYISEGDLRFQPTSPCQPLLRSFHWLRVPELIAFRLAVLVYCFLHGTAPTYLLANLLGVSEVGPLQRLRSATTSALVGCHTQRSTICNRAFAAAAPADWNSLLEDVWSSTSLQLFRRRLKCELFWRSLGPRHST